MNIDTNTNIDKLVSKQAAIRLLVKGAKEHSRRARWCKQTQMHVNEAAAKTLRTGYMMAARDIKALL